MSRHALPSRPTSNRRRTSSGSVTSAVTALASPPLRHDPVGHGVHLAGRACGADDERPFLGIGKRNPLADPAARAGHEGDLALQPVHRGRGVPDGSGDAASTIRRIAAASLDRCRNGPYPSRRRAINGGDGSGRAPCAVARLARSCRVPQSARGPRHAHPPPSMHPESGMREPLHRTILSGLERRTVGRLPRRNARRRAHSCAFPPRRQDRRHRHQARHRGRTGVGLRRQGEASHTPCTCIVMPSG